MAPLIWFLVAALGLALPGVRTQSPCVQIDAGLRYRGTLYLFDGDTYIEIDDDNCQDGGVKNITEWTDLPADVDAGAYYYPSRSYYFFKGEEYFKYVTVIGAFGPYNATTEWHPFFEGGIDAASYKDEVTYFFKGCQYMKSWRAWFETHNEINDIPEGLPCDIDAAWTRNDGGKTIVILKGNQIWYFGEIISGPYQFDSVYTIQDWNLCAPQ